jgi:hypothetical protein
VRDGGLAVAAFTYLWTNDCRVARLDREGEPLTCIAGSLFTARGVGPGDTVYVIAVHDRQVFLIGRLVVERVWDRPAWDAHPDRPPLWEGAEVIEGDGTPMRLTRTVPAHVLRQLGLVDARGREKPLTVTAGMVDSPQSLRNIRRLSAGSAELLDGVLDVGS